MHIIGSIKTKAYEKLLGKVAVVSQGVPKIFRALIWSALRGYLCVSTAVLFR